MNILKLKVDAELEAAQMSLIKIEMMLGNIGNIIHYPEHWDVEEFPDIFDALKSVADHYHCCAETD